jgi:formamidopyrimidine-DNA glycosylase
MMSDKAIRADRGSTTARPRVAASGQHAPCRNRIAAQPFAMPELPEVETMRRGILSVVGAQISDVRFPRCRLKPIAICPGRRQFRQRLIGRTLAAVGRRGKRLVLHLDAGLHVVIEPRMTGLVLLADPPDATHLRVEWHLVGGPATHLWFWDRRGLGTVTLRDDRQLEQQLGPDRLGPDALEVDLETLRARLQTSRRSIKVALLDQKAIAGVGNLYASEILHAARIHPAKTCNRLTRQQWRRLQVALQTVLTEAVHYEGSTLSDGTYRNALNRQGGYQNHHRVYDRAGQTCPTCGEGAVRRAVQAQRSTFWCPVCQRG